MDSLAESNSTLHQQLVIQRKSEDQHATAFSAAEVGTTTIALDEFSPQPNLLLADEKTDRRLQS